MPFQLDLLTRVRNIHWKVGDAIFIILTNRGPYYYVASKTAAPVQRKIALPDSPEGPIIQSTANSYKLIDGSPPKPTFLMTGLVSHEDNFLASAILISNNGTDWRHVFLSDTAPDGIKQRQTTASALVWNPDGSFYYQQVMVRPGLPNVSTPTGFNDWRHDQTYRSPNGETWAGPISEEQVWYGAELQGWRSGFPAAHCMHNDCVDSRDQHVPDGFMHDDTDKGVLMRPKIPLTISYGGSGYVYGASNMVEKIIAGAVIELPVAGLADVQCVAGANGIWMAGGRHGARLSFDDGATWGPVQLDGVSDFLVFSISAASKRDLDLASVT